MLLINILFRNIMRIISSRTSRFNYYYNKTRSHNIIIRCNRYRPKASRSESYRV